MSAPGAQRYVDLDLRVDPSLIGHAVQYARQYLGEWDVMIAAREVALGTGTLPLPIARLVLNCARTDPRWCATLPEPRSTSFVGAFPVQPEPPEDDEGDEDTWDPPRGAPEPRETPGRRTRLRVVPPTRQPRDLAVTWRKRYGYSPGWGKRPQHSVWHVLDPDRSRIRYYPEADEEEHRYSTSIVWVCGARPSTAVLLADPPMGALALPMCRTCQRRLEEDRADAAPDALQDWWLTEQERLTAPVIEPDTEAALDEWERD
jgi:hypothetical protein